LTDVARRQQVARSGYMLILSRQQLLFIYVTVDFYPFVSSNRRAKNWHQFCCRYKKHVDGNMLPGNMLPWFKPGFTDSCIDSLTFTVDASETSRLIVRPFWYCMENSRKRTLSFEIAAEVFVRTTTQQQRN